MKGKVVLVGAGPGDPELITVKGLKALKESDVIIYDRLVSEKLLKEAKPGAELIFAGKEPYREKTSQKKIINLMLKKTGEGKLVVRLKGGDPMVLGRGGEEIVALAEAGVNFEVIPGVTSATAAPTAANIPVTFRGLASSFAVVTGREDPKKPRSQVDFKKLACAVDTIVVLMGVSRLKEITNELMKNLPINTPAVLIENATTPSQRIIEGNIYNISNKAEKFSVKPPAVLVVGDVVKLRKKISASKNKVLLLRPMESSKELTWLLSSAGFNCINVSIAEVVPVFNPKETVAVLSNPYDFIVFTSQISIKIIEEELKNTGLWRTFKSICKKGIVAAIGPKTRGALEEKGIKVHIVPEKFNSYELGKTLISQGLNNCNVLLFRSANSNRDLEKKLIEVGAKTNTVYTHTLKPSGKVDEAVEMLLEGKINAVVLTSPVITRFLEEGLNNIGSSLNEVSRKTTVFSIGPATSKTLKELNVEKFIEAEESSSLGLCRAISKVLGRR